MVRFFIFLVFQFIFFESLSGQESGANYPNRSFKLEIIIERLNKAQKVEISNGPQFDHKQNLEAKIVSYIGGTWNENGIIHAQEQKLNFLEDSIQTITIPFDLENNFSILNENNKVEHDYDDFENLRNDDGNFLILEFRNSYNEDFSDPKTFAQIRIAIKNEDGYIKAKFLKHHDAIDSSVKLCASKDEYFDEVCNGMDRIDNLDGSTQFVWSWEEDLQQQTLKFAYYFTIKVKE